MKKKGRGQKPSGESNFPGCSITGEQLEFLKAMHALKKRLGRTPFPREVLEEAIRLGYRKTRRVTIRMAMKHLRK